MDRVDLTDVTFIIPLRLDTVDRIENLLMTIDFITHHFNTDIHVLEASGFNNHLLTRLMPQSIKYTFVEDIDPIFYRTHYINMMVKDCRSPYIAVWDADVIAPSQQIAESVMLLRNKQADFVYPYEKELLDTSKPIRELYFKTRDLNLLLRHKNKMKVMYPPISLGGAFIVNSEAYIKSGLENPNFYGWGLEDGERYQRWSVLGYTIKRVTGYMFHLSHERGHNSLFNSKDSKEVKTREINRIALMTKTELIKEIEGWQKNE